MGLWLTGDWSTYRLSHFVMFAPRTYYRLFELHNEAIWPAQVAALVAGVGIVILLWRPVQHRERAAAGLLAAAWIWVAWQYFLLRYATIHWAAGWFAGAFMVQALLLAALGAGLGRVRFGGPADPLTRVGIAIVGYAVALHPWVSIALGRPMAQAEVFGIAPDPTVIATLGLVTAASQGHALLLAIPVLWCLYAAATLWSMGSPDALISLFAALAAIATVGWKTLRPRR